MTDLKLCPFCSGKGIVGEYEGYTLELQIVTPLPVTNLTTGKIEKTEQKPYAECAVFTDDRELIESFKIQYCPCCGRKIQIKGV